MTGGNQLKLSAFITGTPFGEAIAEAYQRGAVVGGTSAGASILAEHMIAFGSGGSTPKQRMSQLSVGLGLLRGVVIDQHFEQRNRYGRLLSLVAQSPSLLGIGIDEDTAAVVREGHLLEVVGRGAVTWSTGGTWSPTRTRPSGPRRCWCPARCCTSCRPAAGSTWRPARWSPTRRRCRTHEVVEARAAEADLRRLADDIAAEGVSPANYARHIRRSRATLPDANPRRARRVASCRCVSTSSSTGGRAVPVSSSVFMPSRIQTQPSLTFSQVSGLSSSPECTSRTRVSPSAAGVTVHSTRPGRSAAISAS